MPLIIMADVPPHRPHPTERDTNPSGKRLSYAELEARDERLAALRLAIESVGRGTADFCANHWWYGRAGFKFTLCDIIGSYANQDDDALRTAAAYDCAYQTLYHRLPDCRHEGMCRKGRS